MARHAAVTPGYIARRIAAVTAAAGAALAISAGGASADPDFGPGNSSKGPQDSGAVCHAPGQTAEFPACK
jgi:hypothetical protein